MAVQRFLPESPLPHWACAWVHQHGSDVGQFNSPSGIWVDDWRTVSFEPAVASRVRHAKTPLFITHDIKEAVYLADRVMVFSRRPGRVKACVDVDLRRPRELSIKREARFLEYEDEIWKSIEEEVRASAK